MPNVYEVITDRILKLLEQGTVPWHRPWGGDQHHPRNLASGKKYRGVNVFLLSSAGYDSPYWLTFKQAKSREGNVGKGQRGYPCVFWTWLEREDPNTGEQTKRPFLKYYTVFNVDQCEGIDYPDVSAPTRAIPPIKACENLVTAMQRAPPVHHGGGRASYHPSTDTVHMPPRENFEKSEAYYSTLFHELVHSTGHESRLSRPGITKSNVFGSGNYSKEELVAEMGATYLCGHTGIENAVIDNSASYIASWLGRLRNDSRLVVQGAAQAQKAADYILNRKQDYGNGKVSG